MTDSLTDWPDTTDTEPPQGSSWRAAAWLLGRHPQLAQLATRVPGVVTRDGDGDLDVDLDTLAATFLALQEHRKAWADYEDRSSAPQDDRAYDAWQAAGPQASAAVRAVSVLSGGEGRMLRLLAFLAPTARVPLNVGDTQGIGDGRLVADWCRALLSV